MKANKKKHLAILSLCLLILSLAMPIGAARLSHGADHIASATPMIKSGLVGRELPFSIADFKQALGISSIGSVTITSLPAATEGTLKLSGVRVREGQRIPAASLDKLTFVAATPVVTEASFTFGVSGVTLSDRTCIIRLLDRINEAPSVSAIPDTRLSVTTQKGITLYGSLTATDPEGDALTYLPVSYPANGSLLMTDAESGDFRYIPKAGYTGRDSFSYVARDCYGNYSGVATVSIEVGRRASSLVYDDMTESFAYGAALKMEAADIMQSTIRGDGRYFMPKETVTRADFVVMAMKAAGIAPRTGLTDTFFDDNEEIHETVRGYIATAARRGYVYGKYTDSRLIFAADEEITRAEAAVIVARILELEESETRAVFADGESIPNFAEGAIMTLYDLGLLSRTGSDTISARDTLTREQAASLLAAVMEYTEK